MCHNSVASPATFTLGEKPQRHPSHYRRPPTSDQSTNTAANVVDKPRLCCNGSLYSPAPRAFLLALFSAFWLGEIKPAIPQARRRRIGVLPNFFGEARERSHWAAKRGSSPEGRSKLTPTDASTLTEDNLTTKGASVVIRYM